MPTNILRKAADTAAKPGARAARRASAPRIAMLKAGKVVLRIEMAESLTADTVWQALPLHSTAETWGAALHFETPLEAGRDRTARVNGAVGDVYFWIADDRIVLPWGPTPISRSGELRLPSLCNVIGRALDDPKALAVVRPGEKVALISV